MRPIKTIPFSSILGWSITRYDAFSYCKRRYYYEYYAKHDPDLARATIDKYRSLVSIPLETGAVVHEVVQAILGRLLSSTDEIDEPKLLDFASRATAYHVSAKHFIEVAYRQAEVVEPEDLYPKVRLCLENFIHSKRLQWLRSVAPEAGPEWIVDPPGYGETRLDDLKLYAKVDFLLPLKGKLYIFDWKTGQVDPAKHRAQLVGYASWAAYHFESPPDNIIPSIAYLYPTYSEIQETFNMYDLASFTLQVRAQTQEMYEYCSSVDDNIPLDKDAFRLEDNDRICGICNFRGLCYPDRYPSAV